MTVRERLEQTEYTILAPQAQKSAETKGRARDEEESEVRTCYQRDMDRIVHSKAFRRLMHKTQVFLQPEGDHYRTRMTHTLEVSRIARTIARALRLNEDLAEAIALGHDLGHTPFGHAGERFLSRCYHERTDRYFNHNVHSVRVLDQLYRRNVSLQTLDGVLCHNGEFAQQELKRGHVGTFEALDALVEECTADEQVISTLRPSTLEGCVVRVADMIAYVGKDRQDAMVMGALASLDEFDSTVMGKANAQIINNLTADIVNESYGRDRIAMSEAMFNDLKRAKRQNYEIIYNKEGLAASDGITVGEMFEEVYEKLLGDLTEGREESAIFRHHIDYLARKSRSITRERYVGATEPNQIVVDYIASMTDSYFMALYTHLFPEHATQIQLRGYCADLH